MRRERVTLAGTVILDVTILAFMGASTVTLHGLMGELDEAGEVALRCGGLVGMILWLFSMLIIANQHIELGELEARLDVLEKKE